MFHCFPIFVLYAIMVPHRSLNFTWHHFTLSLFFPPFCPRVLINFPSVLLKFSIAFPFFSIVLCQSPSFFPLFFSSFSPPFPFFPIVLCHIPSFLLLFFSSFSPPLQSAQIHLGGRTRGESIPQRHPIATWYITLKKVYLSHLFYHLFSSFLSGFARSAPRPP